MTEDSIRLNDESDKFRVTVVKAVPPTWRDIWAILRGRYQPKVRRHRIITVAGADREMKEHFTPDIGEQLHDHKILNFGEDDGNR